jgi:hypothetical protein
VVIEIKPSAPLEAVPVPQQIEPVSPVLAVPVLSTSRPLHAKLCLHWLPARIAPADVQRCSPEVMDPSPQGQHL